MQNKTFLNITIILVSLLALYFYIFGFSDDKYIRWGEYGGLALGVYYIIDWLFRP